MRWWRALKYPQYGVKQFVATYQGQRGWFNVFQTGDPKYYLFDPLDPDGCSLSNAFPVLKSRLRPELRRRLAHGQGNAEAWRGGRK